MLDEFVVNCGGTCVPQETEITGVKLANAYVPMQRLCTTFCPLPGLMHGTIFPELVDKYVGRGRRFAAYDK